MANLAFFNKEHNIIKFILKNNERLKTKHLELKTNINAIN